MKASFSFQRGKLIIPPVKITNIKSYRPMMALDTGAKLCVLDPKLASLLNLTVSGNAMIKILGVTGSEWARSVILPNVSILGLAMKDVRAVCHNLPEGLQLDGILGLNFLEHFNIHIDHEKEMVSLELRSA